MRYRLATWLFFGVIAVNVMDRQMMAILAESIRLDLGLSDTQLGALAGPLFAVFYAVAGLPLAMLADRSDRVKVLGWTTAIAGVFAVIAGWARGFATLAVTRAAVAIGDAGGPPAIWSLVSTYYPVEERARRIGLIQIGAPTGAVLAFVLGGFIATRLGWQWGFILIGVAGILIGLAALFLVPEPRRDAAKHGERQAVSGEGWRTLLASPAFRWGLAGVSFAGGAMFAVGIWSPTVLQREYGWAAEQAGLGLGAGTAIAGFTGTYLGGWYASRRRAAGDDGAEFTVPMLALALCVPLILVAAIVPSALVAVGLYGFASFFLLAWNAPSIAGFQAIASERTRALAASLHVFSVNMFGLGLGPLLVGWFSTLLTPSMGDDGLSWALAGVAGASCLGAALCFARAAALQRTASFAAAAAT